MDKKFDAVDLQQVVDRFKQAEENLSKFAEQVRAMALSSEVAREGSDALKQASSQINQFTQSFASTIQSISSAVNELRTGLSSASKYMEQMDLSKLSKAVESISDEIASKLDFSELLNSIKEEQEKFKQTLGEELRKNQKVIKKLVKQNEAMISAMPSRWQNRMNKAKQNPSNLDDENSQVSAPSPFNPLSW